MLDSKKNQMTVNILTRLKQKGMPRGQADQSSQALDENGAVKPMDLMATQSNAGSTASPQAVASAGADSEEPENEGSSPNDLLPLASQLKKKQKPKSF